MRGSVACVPLMSTRQQLPSEWLMGHCKAAEAEHAATLAALQAKTWDPRKGKKGVIEQGGK